MKDWIKQGATSLLFLCAFVLFIKTFSRVDTSKQYLRRDVDWIKVDAYLSHLETRHSSHTITKAKKAYRITRHAWPLVHSRVKWWIKTITGSILVLAMILIISAKMRKKE